jgi:beta-ketoacyl-acyl-carrier-protein synthase II
MSTRRVVITGLGAISPLGLSAQESWESAYNGRSGVGPITHFDASNMEVRIAAEVKGFDPGDFIDPKAARRRDRFENIASAAAKEAIESAGLQINGFDPFRVAVIVSSAIGGMNAFEEAVHTVRDKGPRRVSPFGIPSIMSNGAAGLIGIDHGARGPTVSVASACASGQDGIGTAFNLVRYGAADVAITGGTEATITPVAVAAFDRVGAMSRKNDEPIATPSPFSGDRDGLVMGEGAGILILEELEHARKRGAPILAELKGYCATADAFHITAPIEDGSGGAAAMLGAIEDAGLNAEDVDYINAHGTATVLNDAAETLAIKRAFGEQAYNMPISSTKSMTGHMMGATGALEAVFVVNAIRDNVVPPTINYHEPDPDCDLDYVPNEARDHELKVVISNAFGFGGHNSVLAFSEFTG